MAWTCLAVSGTEALVFIDDVTVERSSRMHLVKCTGTCFLLGFRQTLQN